MTNRSDYSNFSELFGCILFGRPGVMKIGKHRALMIGWVSGEGRKKLFSFFNMEMRMGVLRFFAYCLMLIVLILPSAFGSGFTYDGLGAKARGMGGAFRALADDWSAAYYNPAGYNLIPDNYIAGNLAIFENRYTAITDITWDGYESGFYNGIELYNEHEVLNVPQGAIVARLPLPVLGETMTGFSIMQIFDQNQSWEMFANIPVYSTAAISPKQFYNNLDVVAFQVTAAKGFKEDKLSIGVGLSLLRGDLAYNSMIIHDNPYAYVDDPDLSQIADRPYDKIPEWYHNDGRGWGFGYRAGMLYHFNDNLNLGLTFSGQSSITISGKSEFLYYLGSNPSLAENYFDTTEERYFLEGNIIDITADFETTLKTPNSVGAGIAYTLNEKLTLAVDGEYIFWSQFEGFEFTYTNYVGLPRANFTRANALMTGDITVPIEWDDAGRMMVGADYKVNSYADLRAGFSVDQTALKEDTFIPQFIDLNTKYNYSIGLGVEIGFWHLDFATTYTHHKDLNVPNMTDVDGDGLMDNISAFYKADSYQTVLGISYRF